MKIQMKKFFLGVFMVSVIFAGFFFAQAAKMTPTDLWGEFHTAKDLYKAGKYAEAIKHYENILKNGFESGAVYYNLGNSYFRGGNLAQTILNYERARRLIPRDGDLMFNHYYALSSAGLQNELEESNFFKKLLDGHAQFYTLDEMTTIVTILVVLIGSVQLLSLYLKWPIKIKRICFMFLVTLWIFYTGGLLYKFPSEKNLAIILQGTPAAFEPKEGSTTHFELTPGAKVTVIKREDTWMKIKRFDGKLGWVKEETLEKI